MFWPCEAYPMPSGQGSSDGYAWYASNRTLPQGGRNSRSRVYRTQSRATQGRRGRDGGRNGHRGIHHYQRVRYRLVLQLAAARALR